MLIKVLNTQLNPELENSIHKFLVKHLHNTIFQSPVFYKYYSSLEFYTPYYILQYNNDELEGILLAVVIAEGKGILSRISKRCIIQGGPIVKDDSPEIIDALLKTLNANISKGTLITQFRNYRTWDKKAIDIFQKNGFIFHDHLNLIVTISDPNATFQGFSSSRRRQIRKSLDSGVTLKPASDLSEVEEFYLILQKLYFNKVRKPLPGFEFFKEFYTSLVPAGNGVIILVYYIGKIIGGIVAPITPGKMIYELYICGLDKEYAGQYPSVMATWGAMEWAARNSIPAFDFMGLGKPGVPYGVRDFKLRFGGEQVNFGRFGRSNYKLVYTLAETGYNVLRKLKRV